MLISKYFTLEELTRSDIAERACIDNTCPIMYMENLKFLASKLDMVRDILHEPMFITSGYRCHAVNALVGSHRTSMHTLGLAADFVSPTFAPAHQVATFLAAYFERAQTNFDQLIYEGSWVHISFQGGPGRKEILTAVFSQTEKTSYLPGIRL
jgi:putative chitinase